MNQEQIEAFLAIFERSLAAVREARFFETEHGYQGELLAELRGRLAAAGMEGEPIVEQEHQKTMHKHGITIRPDLVIHIPFTRQTMLARTEGNFVAVEIKRRASASKAREDFGSLELMQEKLHYPLGIFLNIDSAKTHAGLCPPTIAARTVCFSVLLRDGAPSIKQDRCG